MKFKASKPNSPDIKAGRPCSCGCSPLPFVWVTDGKQGISVQFESPKELLLFKKQVAELSFKPQPIVSEPDWEELGDGSEESTIYAQLIYRYIGEHGPCSTQAIVDGLNREQAALLGDQETGPLHDATPYLEDKARRINTGQQLQDIFVKKGPKRA